MELESNGTSSAQSGKNGKHLKNSTTVSFYSNHDWLLKIIHRPCCEKFHELTKIANVTAQLDEYTINAYISQAWASHWCPTNKYMLQDWTLVGARNLRDGHLQKILYLALTIFVPLNWISLVSSLVSLLPPCLYFQTSALILLFLHVHFQLFWESC